MYTLILTIITENSTSIEKIEGFETMDLATQAGDTWLKLNKCHLANITAIAAKTKIKVSRSTLFRGGPK